MSSFSGMLRQCRNSLLVVGGFLLLTTLVSAAEERDRERRPSRELWEWIVGFPGFVMYAPFGVAFYGVEELMDLQVRARVLQRMKNLLVWDDGTKSIAPAFNSRSGLGLTYNDRQWYRPLSRLMIAGALGPRGRHGVLIGAANAPEAERSVRLGLGAR